MDNKSEQGGVMSVKLQEHSTLAEAKEIVAHHPSAIDQATISKEGLTEQRAEKLVDELTDYICDHVTESLKPIQAVIEKRIITRALRETGGCQRSAARILGIKYTTLNYKVKKHKIRIRKVVSAKKDDLFKPSREGKTKTCR